MISKHNILIVDDHRITQSGLRFLFASLDRYAVVGALDCGALVNAFVQSQPVDLVILDLNLPDVRGINVLAEIVGSRDMTVIILTGETHLNEIHSALKLGARAVVSKSDPLDRILSQPATRRWQGKFISLRTSTRRSVNFSSRRLPCRRARWPFYIIWRKARRTRRSPIVWRSRRHCFLPHR